MGLGIGGVKRYLYELGGRCDRGARSCDGGHFKERNSRSHSRTGRCIERFGCKSHIPKLSKVSMSIRMQVKDSYLGNHVAFWMPALISAVPVHFHKLL